MSLLNSRPKAFALDVLLSMAAFALPVLAIYFFIQPGMAAVLGSERYGIALTTIASIQFLDSSFVGALSNVRLLLSGEEEFKCSRNEMFAALLLLTTVLFFLSMVAQAFLGVLTVPECFLTGLAIFLMSCFDYLLVEFRVEINYKRIVLSNVLLITGFGLGFLLFLSNTLWQSVYIIGYLVGLIYPLSALKPFQSIRLPGQKLRGAIKDRYSKLALSNVMTYVVAYGDRLVLFPLMGAASVSVYAAAAVASKAVSFVTTPLNSVLLSYLVKIDVLKMSKRQLLLLGCAIAILILTVCAVFIPISSLLSSILYPQWFDEAYAYIAVIVVGVTVANFSNVLNSVVLRFADAKYQAFLSAIRLVSFLTLSALFTKLYGLIGFCLGSLICEVLRLLIILVLLLRRCIQIN